ncbi:hypothetical protein MATL_G00170640 [Megalops atlanticus]|uniref:G-protein coupled receptors family 1 profile domain-containing protein n=1 Tax=Megalops atlanticus TaxID=7932 RepID=A0A9D3PNU0_MEGAT|nr:hypothetical protein MATL_G00170640 [Megalops atlanticus]
MADSPRVRRLPCPWEWCGTRDHVRAARGVPATRGPARHSVSRGVCFHAGLEHRDTVGETEAVLALTAQPKAADLSFLPVTDQRHFGREPTMAPLQTPDPGGVAMASLALNESGMEDCGIDDSFKYNLYGVVYSVVFVLGLITNCASLFVFCFRMKLRNETTLFMTNLALSDLVFVFTLPFKIFYNVNRHWPFGDGLCKVSGTAFITNIYGSMLFLTCISVDRFLAIVYPFRSRSVRTRRNAGIVCAAVWLLILGGGISVTFFSTTNRANSSTTCFEGFSKKTWKTYLSKITIFIEVVGFLIPLLLNLTCSSLVLRTLRKPATLCQIGTNKERVLRMIVVHVAIFVVCFVPYNSILFLYAMVRSQALASCELERFARTLYPITLCVATLNCCFDPVVYYFTSESFQKSLTTGKAQSKQENTLRSEVPLSSKETADTEAVEANRQASNGKEVVSETHF